jgi:CRP-like cAMP-binding protein
MPADLADGVLVLLSGRVKICQLTADGKQSIMSFIEPGELFGEFAVIGGDTREEYAEAVLPAQIAWIPKHDLLALMSRYPDISLGISKIIGCRRQRIERRLRNLLFQSNRKRLIHLLLELVERYGEPVDDGVRLNIKLTHLEMANVIGSTRETVTVVLGQLQAENLIRVVRRQITIVDLEKLASEVDERSPSFEQTALPAACPV